MRGYRGDAEFNPNEKSFGMRMETFFGAKRYIAARKCKGCTTQ